MKKIIKLNLKPLILLIFIIILNTQYNCVFANNTVKKINTLQKINKNNSSIDSAISSVVGIINFSEEYVINKNSNKDYKAYGFGSGVIIDSKNGYIVTNSHVISNGKNIIVILENKEKLVAKIVGIDPETDIAVIKVSSKNLKKIEFLDSDLFEIGTPVLTIGSPFGLPSSVGSGIVSAKNRYDLNIAKYEDFLQTDAPINPGNSGGAMVDLNGKLVGINTAILSINGSYTNLNIGFAIPSNLVKKIALQLIKFGSMDRGNIGISTQDINKNMISFFNIEGMVNSGVIITDVKINSPAEKCGIKVGDIITHINKIKINSSNQLKVMIATQRINNTMRIDYIRNGDIQKLIIKIKNLGINDNIKSKLTNNLYSLLIRNSFLSQSEINIPGHGIIKGIKILESKNSAEMISRGFKINDIIIEVDNKNLNNINQLSNILKNLIDSNKIVLIKVLRNNEFIFIATNSSENI